MAQDAELTVQFDVAPFVVQKAVRREDKKTFELGPDGGELFGACPHDMHEFDGIFFYWLLRPHVPINQASVATICHMVEMACITRVCVGMPWKPIVSGHRTWAFRCG
jgi:hypothetical protein